MPYNNSKAHQYDRGKMKGVFPPVSKREADRYTAEAIAKREKRMAQTWPEPIDRRILFNLP
jgi:hypothetical protein